MSVRQLLEPTEQEIDRTTQVLFDTNGTNKFIQARHGFDPSILYDNFRSRIEYGCRDGWVYVVSDKVGDIVGAVYFNPPGYDYPESRTRPEGVPRHLERVKDDIKYWQDHTFVPAWTAYSSAAFSGPHQMRPSLYINLIGVDAQYQGTGLGKALMLKVVELADKDNVGMTLITMSERNVQWYAGFGFHILLKGEMDVYGEMATVWSMFRPKGGKASA